MKMFTLALGILVSFSSAQADDRIELNTFTSSIVTLNEEGLADVPACSAAICEVANNPFGTGKCDVLDTIGVVLVDLTDAARDSVLQLSCVDAVEQDGIVYPNPRSGRSN